MSNSATKDFVISILFLSLIVILVLGTVISISLQPTKKRTDHQILMEIEEKLKEKDTSKCPKMVESYCFYLSENDKIKIICR